MKSKQQTNAGWKPLFKIGGIVAFVFLVYSLITMAIVFIIGLPPENVSEIFDLLINNRLVGLLRLDLLTFIVVPLYLPLYLSLYVALKNKQPAYTAIAGVLALAGITLVLATPSVASMVTLSDRYAAATTAAEQASFVAAGEAIMASDVWHATGAAVGGILGLVAPLIFSLTMLGDTNFSKWTAYLGVASNGLDLVRMLLGFFAPGVAFIVMAIAGPLYLFWFPFLGRDLFRLAAKKEELAA